MKNKWFLGVVVLIVILSASCVAGPNEMVKVADTDGELAGFWTGLLHGFISFFTFVVSLFKDSVNVYEVHNSGNWYDFGFILGVSAFFGGSGGGAKKGFGKKKNSDCC